MNTPDDVDDDINKLVDCGELPGILGMRGVRSINPETIFSDKPTQDERAPVPCEIDPHIAVAQLVRALASQGFNLRHVDGRLRIEENHIGKHRREEWQERFRQRPQSVAERVVTIYPGSSEEPPDIKYVPREVSDDE